MKLIEWKYDDNAAVPKESGFYILFLNRDYPKAYDVDPKGILYIGESSNLSKRLSILEKKHKWKKDYDKSSTEMFDHSALTYAVDFTKAHGLIPHKSLLKIGLLNENDALILKYCISNSHEKDEEMLLNGHMIRFGQLPPFNNQGSSLKRIWNLSDPKWDYAVNLLKKLMLSL